MNQNALGTSLLICELVILGTFEKLPFKQYNEKSEVLYKERNCHDSLQSFSYYSCLFVISDSSLCQRWCLNSGAKRLRIWFNNCKTLSKQTTTCCKLPHLAVPSRVAIPQDFVEAIFYYLLHYLQQTQKKLKVRASFQSVPRGVL